MLLTRSLLLTTIYLQNYLNRYDKDNILNMNSQIPRKVLKTLILIGFVYQLYDLTADYLRFNYLIEVEVKPVFEVIPSVTICVNPLHWKYHGKSNLTKSYINDIHCNYITTNRSTYPCQLIDEQIWIRRKRNSICLTFSNRPRTLDHYYHYIRFNADHFSRAEYTLTPNYIHSHFERKNHFILNRRKTEYFNQANFEAKKWEQTLLPFPYSTNCFDYSFNRRNNIRPKSQTDCKLEYMRRKELKVCKHNYYWSQHLFHNNQLILDVNQTFPNCSVKANETFLDKVCQKDCHDIKLFVILRKMSVIHHGCRVIYKRQSDNFYHSTFSGKMDLIAYFSTIGGLISIYLGFGVSDLSGKVINDIGFILTKIIQWIKKGLNFSSDRYKHQMKKLLKILFFSLMLYQLFETTRDYFLNNQKTEIRFRTEYRFPKIILRIFPRLSQTRFLKKYPDEYNELIKLKKLKEQWREKRKEYMYDLLMNNFSEYKYINQLNELSIKSRVKIGDNLVDFPLQLDYIISDSFRTDYSMALIYQFLESRLNLNATKNTPSFLTIELTGLSQFVYTSIKFYSITMLGNFHKNTISSVPIVHNNYNNLIINSNFMKMHPNLRRKSYKLCNESKLGLFSNSMIDGMTIDSINQEFNQTFGCLPAFKSNLFVRFERDLNHFKYTVCPKSVKIDGKLRIKTLTKYYHQNKPFCEIILFTVYNNLRPNDKNITVINIIPKNNLISEFKQNYKMDFNDWVYNCGGIIGLWFGWSAMSITAVMLYIRHNFKLCYRHFRAYYLMKKREKAINYHFIIINNYQVIVYGQPKTQNYFIVIMHKVLNFWRIVGKLFVK